MTEIAGTGDAVGESARRLRCPCCSASWCRCRECTVRYGFGEAIACELPVHASAVPLMCRCGAIVDGPTMVRTPGGHRLALVSKPERPRRRLMARLRAADGARDRFESLIRAARRVARRVPRRETPTAA